MGTNREWEIRGRDSPYFGVLSRECCLVGNLIDANRAALASGAEHIDALMGLIRAHFRPDSDPPLHCSSIVAAVDCRSPVC